MNKYEQEQSELLFNEGVELYEQEKPAEAEKKFLAALELHPDSEEIMYNLALVYFEKEKYELCWNLAAAIQFLDCSELFEELEKAGFKPSMDIPDSIPDFCAECSHFRPVSMIRDEGGFCTFYELKVDSMGKCYAYKMADEGRISREIIEENVNKHLQELIGHFVESLKDERLPQTYRCKKCGEDMQLNETERVTKSFICKNCGTENKAGEKSRALEQTMPDLPEEELFLILLQPQDYRPEFLPAARREINRRNLDLNQSKQFSELLKEYQHLLEINI